VIARRIVAVVAVIAVIIAGCDLGASGPTPTRSATAPATAVPPSGATGPIASPSSTATVAPTASPGTALAATPAPWWTSGGAGTAYPLLRLPLDVARGTTAGRARPTRVAIPSLRINLPVVVPAKHERWPLCDVAAFLPNFDWPGGGGTTYLYAHAQRGMFLPILVTSWKQNGKAMLGDSVYVWTADDLRYEYVITRVRRHQRSLNWAFDLPAESLVLQTSENQYASGPKVMVVARFQEVVASSHAAAHPKAKPRRCG